MLVLSRKTTEAVVIPQYDIVLTILDVKKDQVRLGIAAPQDVRLYRRELWESIQQQHDQPVEKVRQPMPAPAPKPGVMAPEPREAILSVSDGLALAAEINQLIHGWEGLPPDLLGPVAEGRITSAEQELGILFPPSFRAFLRHFGGGLVFTFDILGLADEPGHWLDIVHMNRSPRPHLPRHRVLFIYSGAAAYYLDTSRRDAAGECPVIVLGPNEKSVTVADNFLDFLRKAKEGRV